MTNNGRAEVLGRFFDVGLVNQIEKGILQCSETKVSR
jgi:hypothetical protein